MVVGIVAVVVGVALFGLFAVLPTRLRKSGHDTHILSVKSLDNEDYG